MNPFVFSSRSNLPAATLNALTEALLLRKASGQAILDLTVSNPTLVNLEIDYAPLEKWGHKKSLFPYQANPQGELPARESVAQILSTQGIQAEPNQILLTASTSEAYSLIFKLLCNPGDEVAVAAPGYPLCDALAELEGVTLWRYLLHDKAAPSASNHLELSSKTNFIWEPDWQKLEHSISTKTRALILINPNNPTGHFLTQAQWDKYLKLAEDFQLALIVDAVFWDYSFSSSIPLQMHNPSSVLIFTLGGLSKSFGLPQLKLGWIHVNGPTHLAEPAYQRLEWMSDTYLSVSTPAQRNLPDLLLHQNQFQAPIKARLNLNLERAHSLLGHLIGLDIYWPEAGWSLALQFVNGVDDEFIALTLLKEKGVLVQPGYFFDFQTDGFIVLALLTENSVFEKGLSALVDLALEHKWVTVASN